RRDAVVDVHGGTAVDRWARLLDAAPSADYRGVCHPRGGGLAKGVRPWTITTSTNTTVSTTRMLGASGASSTTGTTGRTGTTTTSANGPNKASDPAGPTNTTNTTKATTTNTPGTPRKRSVIASGSRSPSRCRCCTSATSCRRGSATRRCRSPASPG